MQKNTFIRDMTEDDWKSINDYRMKHPDIEGKWLKYRYAEKIPLDDIDAIMEPTPVIRGMVSHCNAHIGEQDGTQKCQDDSSSANYFATPKDPKEELVMLLEHEIAFEDKNGRKYINIFEIINWIEKKKSIDPNFVYSLKKPFVEYYKKRNKVMSYDELKAENLLLKERCASLEKKLEKFTASPEAKKRKLIQRWASEIKTYSEKFKIQITPSQLISLFFDFFDLEMDDKNRVKEKHGKKRIISGLSRASLRNYIIKTGLFTVGKQGNRALKNEVHTKIIHQLLSLPEYQKFKTEFEEIKSQLKK